MSLVKLGAKAPSGESVNRYGGERRAMWDDEVHFVSQSQVTVLGSDAHLRMIEDEVGENDEIVTSFLAFV